MSGNGKAAAAPGAPGRLRRIDAAMVRVGGLLGARLERTWRGNLLQLHWERDFLAPFRAQSSPAGSYAGLGKTLDAIVRFAHHTGDAELLGLKQWVVDELVATQLSDGYMGLYAAADRLEFCWDVHEQAYLLFALVSDWRLFRGTESLRAAVRLGDYLVESLTREVIQRSEPQLSPHLVFCGLDRAMLALCQATHDARYLDLCLRVLDLAHPALPIVEGRHGRVEGHVYAYLTRALAQVELYHITGDEALLAQSRRALSYLQAKGSLVISGTNGIDECWHSDHTGCGDLGETCATAYLIRLCECMLRLQGDSGMADLLERALYNALLAAQSPDGRQLRYYVPLEGERAYWPLDTYCCPGNFRRIMAEVPEMIYYLCGDGLVVNLYTESQAATQLAPGLALTVRQHTRYPANGRVDLYIELSRSDSFTLYLRRPGWCRHFTVMVNGEMVAPVESSGFLSIAREWKNGDVLQFEMAMPPRLVRGIETQAGRAAVMAGPVVYTLSQERNPGVSPTDMNDLILTGDIRGPFRDEARQGHGSVCRATTLGSPGELLLTDFTDPAGVRTYFRAEPGAPAVNDELLSV